MIQNLPTEDILNVKTGVIMVTSQWCHACQPAFLVALELAKSVQIPVYTVDMIEMDDALHHNPDWPRWGEVWGIEVLPTFLIFIRGNLVSKMPGPYDAPTLIGAVEGWMEQAQTP